MPCRKRASSKASAQCAGQKITVVAMTNTTFEGMWGPFTREVRDAVYGRH